MKRHEGFAFSFEGAAGFLDRVLDHCIDGKPCDSNGDTVYTVNGVRIRERDFKEYRKFSPQFREFLIMDNFEKNEDIVTEVSCSCSKCGSAAIDSVWWI